MEALEDTTQGVVEGIPIVQNLVVLNPKMTAQGEVEVEDISRVVAVAEVETVVRGQADKEEQSQQRYNHVVLWNPRKSVPCKKHFT